MKKLEARLALTKNYDALQGGVHAHLWYEAYEKESLSHHGLGEMTTDRKKKVSQVLGIIVLFS